MLKGVHEKNPTGNHHPILFNISKLSEEGTTGGGRRDIIVTLSKGEERNLGF